MSSSVLEEFFISIGVDADDIEAGSKVVTAAVLSMQKELQGLVAAFNKSSDQAGESQKKLGKSTDKLTKDLTSSISKARDFFGGFRRELLAFAGLTLSIGGATSFIKDMTNGAQQLGVMSKAMKSSARDIDGWRKSYEMAGASAAEADANLRSMADTVQQFHNGNHDTPMANLARTLGVNLDYSENASASDNLRLIYSALSQVRDPQRQLALTKSAQIPEAAVLRNNDGKLLPDQLRMAQLSTFSDEETRKAAEFRAELSRLGAKFDNLKNKIFSDLLPSLDALLNDFNKWYDSNTSKSGELTSKVDELTGINLDKWTLADDIRDLIKNFGEFGRTLSHITNALNALNEGNFKQAFSELKKAWSGDAGNKDALPGVTKRAENFRNGILEPYRNVGSRLNSYLPEWMRVESASSSGSDGKPVTIKKSDADKIDDKSHQLDEKSFWSSALDKLSEIAKGIIPDAGASEVMPTISTGAVTPFPAKSPSLSSKGRAFLNMMSGQFGQLEAQYGLPLGLLRGVAATESGGDPRAKSKAGAKGLFQFMDGTAADMGLRGDDVYDPSKSAQAAAKYLSQLMKRYGGDIKKALAAYNWGMGNIDKHGLNGLPAETAAYYPKVLAAMNANRYSQQNIRQGDTNNASTTTTHIQNVTVTSNPTSVSELTESIRNQTGSRVFAYSSGQS